MVKLNKNNQQLAKEVLKKRKISSITNNQVKASEKIFTEIIEYLGERFKLEDTLIYRISRYNKLLIEANNKYEDFNAELIEKKIKNKETIKLVDRCYFIKYLFNKLEKMENNPKIKKELCNLALLFEKDILAALYLYTISRR
jgi:hypothetical protein